MQPEAWGKAAEALGDLDFPASKDAIVAHASARSGGQEVLRLLNALPLGTYENIAEVRRSVPLDIAADEGQTVSQRVDQNRSRHSRQIAEHVRDVERPEPRRRGGI